MMKYEFIQIGSFHTNHCEDSLFSAEIDNNKWLLAVMDGCSMGTDSYFASAIVTKILKKYAKETFYKAFFEEEKRALSDILEEAMHYLFCNLIDIEQKLALEREELLCTIVVAVVDAQAKKAETIAIGDGLVVFNDKFMDYEQNDRPDYMAYHLKKDFKIWYKEQKQRLSLDNLLDLSICTDGIFTFRQFDNRFKIDKTAEEIIDVLLINKQYQDSELMLKRK